MADIPPYGDPLLNCWLKYFDLDIDDWDGVGDPLIWAFKTHYDLDLDIVNESIHGSDLLLKCILYVGNWDTIDIPPDYYFDQLIWGILAIDGTAPILTHNMLFQDDATMAWDNNGDQMRWNTNG